MKNCDIRTFMKKYGGLIRSSVISAAALCLILIALNISAADDTFLYYVREFLVMLLPALSIVYMWGAVFQIILLITGGNDDKGANGARRGKNARNPFIRFISKYKDVGRPAIVAIVSLVLVIVVGHIKAAYEETAELYVIIILEIAYVTAVFFCAAFLISTIAVFVQCFWDKGDNKKELKYTGKRYSAEEIEEMVRKCDIIDIHIKYRGKIVSVGSSAVSDADSSVFTDKLYYINDQSFTAVENFSVGLKPYAIRGCYVVTTIDGVKQK